MSITAVICEYNPLHLGHEYQISTLKHCSDDAVIAIMSDDFVQRGEAAVYPKSLRAEAAVASGCDLVLELPAPYSFGSAEYFARAGVYIADAVGVCDKLNFGSESGDIDELTKLSELIAGEEFTGRVAEILERDKTIGYMQARSLAAGELFGADVCRTLTSPNNILGLEYIKSAKILGAELKLETLMRRGDGYNDKDGKGEFVSASFLREHLYSHSDISAYVPKSCAEIYKKSTDFATLEKCERSVLSFFRLSEPERLSHFAEVSDGLEYRLCRCAAEAKSLSEFFLLAATKKYTNARLRRAVLSCMLGVYEEDFKASPAFTRVLAANSRGRELLKRMKKTSKIEIVTNGSPAASKNAVISERVQALYSLCFDSILSADASVKTAPYIDKK